jgi:hypothetical protein
VATHERLHVRGFVVQSLVPASTAHARQRLVDGNSRQPGRKPGGAVELAQVRKGVDVGLLHHVLRLLLVTHDRPGRTVDPFVVPAHQQLEERGVSAQNLLDHEIVRLFTALN